MEIIAKSVGKTIYKDGDKRIKIFDENYSKAGIFNEAMNQARIEETGLNIPKILEITMVNGKWAIIEEFIEGKSIAQLWRKTLKNTTNTSNSLLKFRFQFIL